MYIKYQYKNKIFNFKVYYYVYKIYMNNVFFIKNNQNQ